MRIQTIVLLATLLVAPAIAAPLPEPQCENEALSLACVRLVIGDIVVLNGQVAQYNNATYVFGGSVTVLSGGRVEIILSDVAFGEEPLPIHVQPGGTILIDGSDLAAAPDGTAPVIQLDAGANVEIYDSQFSAITLDVAASDATIDGNDFLLGSPAVRLRDFTGTFAENDFLQNSVGVNVTGGAPTLEDLTFLRDTQAVQVYDAAGCILRNIDMADVSGGVSTRWSHCTMTSMALHDQSLPPTMGFDIQDTTDTTTISFNDISEFGTGIFYCRADVSIHDNEFSGNGADVVSC